MTLHTYKTLHQRCISIEVNTGEKQYSLCCQLKKNKFSTQTTPDGVGNILEKIKKNFFLRFCMDLYYK
jgi:hypothetical protein